MLYYITIFIVIGFLIGMATSENEDNAFQIIIFITLAWAFVFGWWAVASFVELIIGYSIYRKRDFISKFLDLDLNPWIMWTLIILVLLVKAILKH
jgi:predicted Co/Zn/Cd cation transporter (cation efflux family)